MSSSRSTKLLIGNFNILAQKNEQSVETKNTKQLLIFSIIWKVTDMHNDGNVLDIVLREYFKVKANE